jgi:hypothetical protein
VTTASTLRVRVVTAPEQLVVGQEAQVQLEVTNASTVIDGIEARLWPPEALEWHAEPALLPLFPDDSGLITLVLSPQESCPAGELELPVELVSTTDPQHRELVTISTVVVKRTQLTLDVTPQRQTTHARATVTARCANASNTAIDVDLSVVDASHQVRSHIEPPTLVGLAAGSEATATIELRLRRRLLGTETALPLTVVATAEDTHASAELTLTHRPLLSRGVRTVAILAAIVAAWAVIVLLALSHALATTPLAKVVPASFYASSTPHARGAAPAGAIPKSGLAIGVGGTLSGTVDAASTGSGVGRIIVQAFAVNGSSRSLIASAATSSTGSWSIPGLAPGRYLVAASAPGYRTTWYSNAASAKDAKAISVAALATLSNLNLTIQGLPGTVIGTVDTGESPSPPVTVTVLPESRSSTSHAGALATTTTSSNGSYTLSNLPTPGVYNLSFSANGFAVGQSTVTLVGGQHLSANTVVLTASPGTISGLVEAGGQPLGGVTVTAKGSGTTVTTTTPTTGPIGTYTLTGLPTPGTYAITFSAPGYGSTSIAEQLGPGQSQVGVDVTLVGGAGDIAGTVTSPSGAPIGNATVTASIGSGTVSATAATTGPQAGSYLLTGLPTPGTYAITFSAPGYQSVTQQVSVGTNAHLTGVNATLSPATGTVSGTVTNASGSGVAGATVTITNGSTTITTVSTSSPAGSFVVPSVPPGTYAVTATLNGSAPYTATVTVTPGATSSVTLVLATSSGAG